MFKFDVYSFYARGYSVGFLPKKIVQLCRQVIENTEWYYDNELHVKYPAWNMLPDDGTDEYYQEIIRELKSLNSAPSELKYIGECILSLPYFDELKRKLVKAQHKQNTWMRTFVPNGFGLWNGQVNLPWHSDINDSNHITILAYFTKNGEEWNRDWNGQLRIGVENENGDIDQVYEHYPIDGTFVVINNMSPLFQHSVVKNVDGKDRYTMSFRYCIK